MSPTSYDGRMTPVILLPRFTTLLGQDRDEFLTLPIDVTAFESARITLWRATLQGTGVDLASTFFFDESTDRDTWTACEGTIPSQYLPANTELVVEFGFGRKWFRLRVRLNGTDPAATCWAQGFFIRRQR